MTSNNKKIPVIQNINALNAEIAYLRKKRKQKPSPDPPTPEPTPEPSPVPPSPTPSDNPIIYQISFFYDEEYDEINPADHKNEYGFNIETDPVISSVRKLIKIRSLVYSDGETITNITPQLYSKAVDIIEVSDPDHLIVKPQYNIYVYIPYKTNDTEENVWAGYKSISTKYD